MSRSGPIAPGSAKSGASPSSVALANLRGVVILIVLAFHSFIAYLYWTPHSLAPFASPPYDWRSFPIQDTDRFFGFDLFCAWQDVYLMSLMFFLSGLFVWPSLTRKREWGFVRDRTLRLGLPYVFGLLVLMPIAFYPAYAARTADPTVAGYWHDWLSLPFWPNGQLWFLWQLLALNIAVAAVYRIAPHALKALGDWSAATGLRPNSYFVALAAASACVYVPAALAFTPWQWSETGFLAVQWCRPLHYAVYFFAGVGVSAAGIERGLLAADGALPRRWAFWLTAALVSLVAWMGFTALTLQGEASFGVKVATYLAFVIACASGSFFALAASLHFGTQRLAVLGSLSTNAYSLYIVHYNFMVWLQFALLGLALFAVVKAAIVFAGVLALSFLTTLLFVRVPFGARLLGAQPRALAVS
jgi:glucans biosynthesis protein C